MIVSFSFRRTFEQTRKDLFQEFQIDISEEHAQPQTTHLPTSTEAKRNFFEIKSSIIEFLFKHLLNERKPLTLPDAYELLPKEFSEELKSERGGLKSIILSYRHALSFDPIKKLIHLADPKGNSVELKEKSTSKKILRFKTKNCFFHLYHPNGCPLTDDQCAFSHRMK